jgi:hypothetical protein
VTKVRQVRLPATRGQRPPGNSGAPACAAQSFVTEGARRQTGLDEERFAGRWPAVDLDGVAGGVVDGARGEADATADRVEALVIEAEVGGARRREQPGVRHSAARRGRRRDPTVDAGLDTAADRWSIELTGGASDLSVIEE